MTVRSILLAAVLALIVWPVPSGASNGMKPTASSGRALGRGGADIAWGGTVNSINANPALLMMVRDEQFEITPTLFRLGATYSDRENSTQTSKADFFPYANASFAFDLTKTREEHLEELRETRPRQREELIPWPRQRPEYSPPHDDDTSSLRTLHRNIPVPIRHLPGSIRITARGQNATLFNISAVANYRGSDGKLSHSAVLGA